MKSVVRRIAQVLALAGLAWGPDQVLAQTAAAPPDTGLPHQVTVTDAAGVVHTPSTRMKHAQRQAAAAARKKTQASATTRLKSAGTATLQGTGGATLTAAPVGAPVYDPAKGPDYFGQYSNYANSPLPVVGAGGAITGGMRKFVDGLPGLTAAAANNLGQYLPVAIPDTTTYPGSDYYEIELGEYTEQMHSDLPPTTLRGYRQTNTTDTTVSVFHYLGPIIVAQRDRPVRVKFTNSLPAGAGGDLFIPVDKTIMGAGPGPNVSDAARLATKADALCAATPSDCYTENRATVHLHGGVTPWISDGTTHQWITPGVETTVYPKGLSQRNVPDMWYDPATHASVPAGTPGATNDPGPGSMTFYYTNQQSARLMFYHDHASGITRLNVYAGEAAGYLLTDPVEQALVNGGTVGALAVAPGTIPATQIPLVIQDKTFVPPPAQLAATDPSWDTAKWGGLGSLWFPHVYMTNQNPWDATGANAVGRWDYGPWFWPPFTGLLYGEIPNPYYNAACNPALGFCEPPMVPGVPIPSSNVPETFVDTPVINGTAYPTLTVAPKAYRFRILNAANDRMWNLSLWVAADKKTTTMDPLNEAAGTTASTPVLCDGAAAVPASDCTEVKMVPFDGTYGATHPFPASWGFLDGRAGGVPDPATAGPSFIQIGTEGGFLPAPAVIPPQPVNYTYNRRNIVVLNVQEKALFMGPAERADVIVDFSAYAGKTLILYNDAPAPVPAADPRLDYYTGSPDFSVATGDGTGGAPRVLPGYGPNTRTIMQIVVSNTAATPFDPTPLSAALPAAFAASQEPIIVPQAAYNPVYGTTTADLAGVNLARIQDTSLTFTPIGQTAPLVLSMEPKAIIEDFQPDYGRMNATLGVEILHTNNTNQTSIIQTYNDPPTEIVKLTDPTMTQIGQAADGTQIWKITHNGVDTHAMHFHMFHVQVVNRVGWDGAIYPPDANELGWKDTVRMNPLEDVFVAIRPRTLTTPFKVPNSFRPLAPQLPIGSTLSFTNVDPAGLPVTVVNQVANFGWEYVWHCHLLGHEENDMMRALVIAAPPEAPTPGAIGSTNPPATPGITLSWTDNSLTASGFRINRADNATFTLNPVSVDLGLVATYTDTDAALVPGQTYYYSVQALNTVGSSVPGYPTITAESVPATFPAAQFVPGGFSAQLTPAALTFALQALGTTSAAQTVTLTNIGAGVLTISSIGLTGVNTADFVIGTNTCGATLNPAASCTVNVAFAPTAINARTAGLAFTTSDAAYPVQTVALSGTGGGAVAGIAPAALVFAAQGINTTSAAQVVTLSNTGVGPLTITGVTIGGTNATAFANASTCGATLAAAASCTMSITFKPMVAGALSATLNVASNDPVHPLLSVALSGTGSGPMAAAAPSPLTFATQAVGTTSGGQAVTLSNSGNVALTISSIAVTGANATNFTQVNACGASLAPAGSCAIIVTFTPTAGGARTANLAITTNDPVNPGLLVLLGGTGAVPIAGVAPTSLTFASRALGTSSAAQTLTLSNTGNAPLVLTSVAVSGANAGDFAQVNACGASVAAGGSCAINVTFTPTAVGARAASVVITSNDPVNPSLTAGLSGTGAAGVAGVAPTSLTFAGQVTGTTSAAQTVTLSNSGAASLTINSIGLTGANAADFLQTSTCGVALAPAANCVISVSFAPSAVGARAASLTIASNDPVTPSLAVPLSGTGIAGTPALSVAPTALSFATAVGTTSAAQVVTVRNTGGGAMTISGISLGGSSPASFAQTNNCGASLAAGASCTINVTFSQNSSTAKTATLSVNVAAPAVSQSVSLTGTIVAPTYTLSPASLSFLNVPVGSTSPTQAVTLTNTGTLALTINAVNLGGTNPGRFSQTNNCGTSVAAGVSCTINVAFRPNSTTAASALLVVSVPSPAVSQQVTLSGTAAVPTYTVAPTSLTFAAAVGTTSPAQAVTVTNTSTIALPITSITLGGDSPTRFAQTNNCGTSLAGGASCTINVTFSQNSSSTKAATLTVTVPSPLTSQRVNLTGTVLVPSFTLSPTTLAFTSPAGVASAAQTVTVTNTSTISLGISTIAIVGTNMNRFSQTNNCGTSLAGGATCSVNVVFTPTGVTNYSAQLRVTPVSPTAMQSVALTGIGQ